MGISWSTDFIKQLPKVVQDKMKDIKLYYTIRHASRSAYMTYDCTLNTIVGKMIPYSSFVMNGTPGDSIARSYYVGPYAQYPGNDIFNRNKAEQAILEGKDGNPPISQLPYFKTSSNQLKYKYDGTICHYYLLNGIHKQGGSVSSSAPIETTDLGCQSYHIPSSEPSNREYGDSYFFCL